MKITFRTKVIYALIGIVFIGIGIGINASALLGNDAVAILYDGVRSALNLGYDKLGLITNVVNITLIILLFFIGRRYLNVGTLIYILPLGTFVSLGTRLYTLIVNHEILLARIISAVIGCSLTYIGVGIYVAMNIGLDPFTGLVMVIKDKVKFEFKYVKIGFDICLIAIGFLLGGKFGFMTLITAFVAGPMIQFVSTLINKRIVH